MIVDSNVLWYTYPNLLICFCFNVTEKDFIEVETPSLDIGAGGANADPFVTHHNELKLPMYLRIAPELALKQLVIGGMLIQVTNFPDFVLEIDKEIISKKATNFET